MVWKSLRLANHVHDILKDDLSNGDVNILIGTHSVINKNLKFNGPKIFIPNKYEDNRGFFIESWNKKIFEKRFTKRPFRKTFQKRKIYINSYY